MGIWCIYWDPCGLACLTLGAFTVGLANYVTLFEILGPWFRWNAIGIFQGALFQFMVLCIAWSYIRAATTDPGSVTTKTTTEDEANFSPDDHEAWLKMKRRYCAKCQCIKPPRAHHCRVCQRCINRMDHHCPWVNNCVGSNNFKYFLNFLLWTCVGSGYAATLAIWRFAVCWRTRCVPPPPHAIIMCVMSTVLAILFCIFTAAMMWDQYTGVTTDTTAVEAAKQWRETPRDLKEGLEDVCGEKCGMRWFLPVAMRKDSPAYYQWKPSDDPDAYDPRDPLFIRHITRIEKWIAKGGKHVPKRVTRSEMHPHLKPKEEEEDVDPDVDSDDYEEEYFVDADGHGQGEGAQGAAGGGEGGAGGEEKGKPASNAPPAGSPNPKVKGASKPLSMKSGRGGEGEVRQRTNKTGGGGGEGAKEDGKGDGKKKGQGKAM